MKQQLPAWCTRFKMIHYHGTPIGGSRQDTARLLIGRHALVPYPRQDDMPVVAEVCQSFCLDNGAYTAWRKGTAMDYEGNLQFVEQWHKHPGFDFAIIPDVIGGTEAENDRYLDMWPGNFAGVPVYHIHLPVARLKKLADKYPRVALGSSGDYPVPGQPKWWERMNVILNAVCDAEGRPPCKLHGLRMLDPLIFTRLPLASADSTNVAQNNSKTGPYSPPTTAQRSRVIAERIEVFNSAPFWAGYAEQLTLF